METITQKIGGKIVTVQLDTDNRIDMPFADLYPINSKSAGLLSKALGYEQYNDFHNHSLSSYTNIWYKNMGDSFLVIFEKGKAIKKSTVEKLFEFLELQNCTKATILVPEMAKSCGNLMEAYYMNDKEYLMLKVDEVMTNEAKGTVPKLLGRYAKNYTLGDPKKPKQRITITIPVEGFPDLGYSGLLTAKEIYQILDSKVNPSSVESNQLTNALLESFQEFTKMISGGKTITVKRWNAVLDKHKVFTLLEEGE